MFDTLSAFFPAGDLSVQARTHLFSDKTAFFLSNHQNFFAFWDAQKQWWDDTFLLFLYPFSFQAREKFSLWLQFASFSPVIKVRRSQLAGRLKAQRRELGVFVRSPVQS